MEMVESFANKKITEYMRKKRLVSHFAYVFGCINPLPLVRKGMHLLDPGHSLRTCVLNEWPLSGNTHEYIYIKFQTTVNLTGFWAITDNEMSKQVGLYTSN